MTLAITLQFFLVYVYWLKEDFVSNTTFSHINKLYFPLLKYEADKIINRGAVYANNADRKINAIPVLTYHGIVEREDGSNILLEKFFNQMLVLKKAGYKAISLEDFSRFMRGEKEILGKPFLLTFDDGRKDSYYPVDPILKALNWKAVIFVITEHFSERSNYYLSKKELKKMVASDRWEVQAHTRNGHDFRIIDATGRSGHFYSNKLWRTGDERIENDDEFRERIVGDIVGAKQDVENNLRVKVFGFAYPFGDYGQESINYSESQQIILDAVKKIYSVSFYQTSFNKDFSSNYREIDDFLFRRISVKPNWTAENLLQILESGTEKAVPFVDNFSDYVGWIKTVGNAELTSNSLIIKSGRNTTGAVFLDGTRSWKDYVFNAKVDWKKGSNVVLLARYNDSDNYLDCNFSSDWLRIEKVIDGKKFIKENKIDADFSKTNLNLGIKVNGENIECMLDNKIIGSADIETDKLSKGGIGFKVWDKEVGNSELEVLEVSVNK